MEVHEFSNWLNEIQIKLIDKHRKQSISDEVKRHKFLNNIPPYMEESLKPQIKDNWTYERIVEAAEGYEAAHEKDRNTITTRQGSKQVSHPVHHPTTPPRNKDPRRRQQTGFNPSNKPSPRLSNNNNGKYPDWDTVNETLTPVIKMKLIREKQCLWCHNEGHNFKDCCQCQQGKPMRTAAQSVSTELQPLPKFSTKGKYKLQPAIEPLDNSKVQVQINGHNALALVNLQTKGSDLINSQLLCLFKIPTKSIEKKSLSIMIQGS